MHIALSLADFAMVLATRIQVNSGAALGGEGSGCPYPSLCLPHPLGSQILYTCRPYIVYTGKRKIRLLHTTFRELKKQLY